jgi:hypothetical protein
VDFRLEELMTETEFVVFLRRMGEIAKVVNSFTSEAVQRDAFATLLASLNDDSVESPGDRGKSDHPSKTDGGNAAKTVRARKRENSATPKPGGSIDRDLNLRPTGKQSFADFIALKRPVSNQDKFAVVVYYLEQVLELPTVSASQVRTVFRLTEGWREPADVDTALPVTALRKATIDTSDMEHIKTTAQGRNFVEHDLPAKSDKK